MNMLFGQLLWALKASSSSFSLSIEEIRGWAHFVFVRCESDHAIEPQRILERLFRLLQIVSYIDYLQQESLC